MCRKREMKMGRGQWAQPVVSSRGFTVPISVTVGRARRIHNSVDLAVLSARVRKMLL